MNGSTVDGVTDEVPKDNLDEGDLSDESEVELPVFPGIERHKTKLTIAEFYAPTPEVPGRATGLSLSHPILMLIATKGFHTCPLLMCLC